MATTIKSKTVTTKEEALKAQKRSEAAIKAAQTRKAKAAAVKAEQEKQEVEAVVSAQPVKICDVICDTLMLIRPGSETEGRPRGEGYSYKECLEMVLEKVHKHNPDAKTSLDCLRWYAAKMRSEGVILPYRPRNSPIRASAATPADPME